MSAKVLRKYSVSSLILLWQPKSAQSALSSTVFKIQGFLWFAIFAKKFKNSKWPLYLARQKYFENWHGYSAEISSRSKILLNSLHLAQFSRYKHFCVLQKLRKFKITTIFGETKIFENKTTAAVCISRRALK